MSWVYGRSLAGIAGSDPTGGMDVCCDCFVCCQVEVTATGLLLVHISPTDCGVSVVIEQYLRGDVGPLDLLGHSERRHFMVFMPAVQLRNSEKDIHYTFQEAEWDPCLVWKL
jgi:hypothetical protein